MSKLQIYTQEKKFPTTPDLYGLFFEDISHAGDGGLYPEMIRNRSFEDSLLPEGCTTNDDGKTFVSPTGWIDEFNNGEGMNDWVKRGNIEPTPIPAWYSVGADMSLDEKEVLNNNRKASLTVEFEEGGRIYNTGYRGIPQEQGKTYHLYFFAKADAPITLSISIQEGDKPFMSECPAHTECVVQDKEWARYDAYIVASETTGNARLYISAKNAGKIQLGFTSLMPEDTYNGHGLRKDLVEKLRDMNPSFLRFPGGCIVEGFTIETAMYFKNTVGPVWERPSHWLLWHYRTTNGLGFHEYLQLCEDLQLSALYVCNCGMTCQGRGPYYFNEQEFAEMCEDTLNAIEYALGAPDTKWGGLRAEMGHEAPFNLKYLEIGNENSGSEYAKRYEIIRQAVLAKYPQMIIVTNDRDKSIKADIIDDHYYNMPEYFAEKLNIYDDYDRANPDIFVGEFAVNQTYEGQLRAAVSEAMFMIGFERNQDVVKLASYAPLFEHVHFYSWYPNLIIFDNLRSYTIPSYYVWKLFGGNRGEYVVKSVESVDKIYRDLHGLPMVSGDYGIKFRNARYNDTNVNPYKALWGKVSEQNGELTLTEDTDGEQAKHPMPFPVSAAVALGSDVESKTGVFDVDIYAKDGCEIGVGMLCAPKPFSFYDRMNPNPRDEWELWNMEPLRWMIKDGRATLVRGGFRPEPIAESVAVNLKLNEYNHFHYELSETEVKLYLNDELIQTVELPNYQAACSVVTDTKDEVIVKYVNFSEKPDNVEITLDCDIQSDYTVSYLSGKADAENSLASPDNVQDKTKKLTGAGRSFIYTAEPLSVNVLSLKKL